MSRPRAVSKKEFLKAYAENKTVVDLAIALGVCEMTVRNYLIKLGLNVTGTIEKRKKSREVFNAYRGRISLPELAKKLGSDIVTTRYQIRKGMIDLYSGKDKPKWPRPHLISHIKIVHALEENPKLKRDRDKLSEETGLSEESVDIYLSRLVTKSVKKRR